MLHGALLRRAVLTFTDQPNRREKGYKKLKVLDVRGNKRLDYPPPSYLLRAEEIGEYLEKLKEASSSQCCKTFLHYDCSDWVRFGCREPTILCLTQ